MRVLTVFARPGYRISKPLFLPDGEFLPESTTLTEAHLKSLRSERIKVVDLEPDPRIREWECVPELNAFMSTISERFQTKTPDAGIDMIRCAVEDVYTRFLFDLESEN